MSHRIIKFRAWNPFSKTMTYSPVLSDGKDGGETACIDINDAINNSEIYLMQFTGIKDRNGREIFEGDIVNVNGGNHIIEWRGAGFAATWSDYNLDSCWFVGGGPVVIGNIYENPELAEKARKGSKA